MSSFLFREWVLDYSAGGIFGEGADHLLEAEAKWLSESTTDITDVNGVGIRDTLGGVNEVGKKGEEEVVIPQSKPCASSGVTVGAPGGGV